MKLKILILQVLFIALFLQTSAQEDSITISGVVTDYDGNLMDSCLIELFNANFRTAYETYTDKKGEYKLLAEKGTYLALGALKMSEYPIAGSTLPKDEQRLEFWAWNVIAQKDLKIDIKYHRLEVYGVNVFRIQGATPGYTIYCRPMSLSRGFSNPELKLDEIDLCPEPNELKVNVKINGSPVNVNMKQKVEEFANGILFGFLIHVDLPKEKTEKPYDIFHIEMVDLKTGDKGEAMYFMAK